MSPREKATQLKDLFSIATTRFEIRFPLFLLVDCFPNPNATYASLYLTSGVKTPVKPRCLA
jgi:hypothetical protein